MNDEGPIEVYLDDLLERLSTSARRTRRILSETEAHLRESAHKLQEEGLAQLEAEQQAIEQFGTPREVARRFAEPDNGLPSPSMLIQLAMSLAALAGVGFVAIGASGLISLAFGSMFGKSFVSADTPGVTYTTERCADFQRFHPEASDCAEAATLHHFDEVVGFRFDAGILGLLILAGYGVVRWRYRKLAKPALLPPTLTPSVGAALFGVAALGLLGISLTTALFGDGRGVGAMLSGGIVSVLMFAIYLRQFVGRLRAHA